MTGPHLRDPHESGTRLPRFAKQGRDEQFLEAFNSGLRDMTQVLTPAPPHPDQLPILYIVGVPRSGTTLLSQLVSRYLPVGYINNLIARCWSRPSVGIGLSRSLFGDRSREGITFQSSYGTTQEVVGPHEFGYFWRHWLALDQAPHHHLSVDAVGALDAHGLKQALEQEILGAFEQPVVFKNVICGFHAAYLATVHPRSLFIHITRDQYAAATSILEARQLRYGSYDVWWSLKPSTYPFRYQGDPGAEVAQQVRDCRTEFECELSQPGVQAMTVSYEALCENPAGVLDEIAGRVRAFGIPFERLNEELPHLFPTPPSTLPEDLQRRVRECLPQESVNTKTETATEGKA